MNIYKLSEPQLAEAFHQCVGWVEESVANPNETYASLAARIGVGESALKQFVSRGRKPSSGSIRRGASFDKIFIFMNKINGETHETYRHDSQYYQEDSLTDLEKSKFYLPLMKMLKIKKESMLNIENKILERRFFCIRSAISKNLFVVSEITFRQIKYFDGYPIWEFQHHYIDGNGVDKKSDGVVFTQHKNVYMFGDISSGEGIETLIIRESPSISNFLFGFMVSSDDYKPFFANMIFIEANFANNHIKNSKFSQSQPELEKIEMWDAVLGIVDREFVENLYLGNEIDFGKNKLVKYLENTNHDNAVIRIGDPFIVPRC